MWGGNGSEYSVGVRNKVREGEEYLGVSAGIGNMGWNKG